MSKLIMPTLRTFLISAIALGILLFLPAWTLNYWQAWIFITVFMTAANAIGVYLSLKDPELLERRKKMGPAAETSTTQKIIILLRYWQILRCWFSPRWIIALGGLQFQHISHWWEICWLRLDS